MRKLSEYLDDQDSYHITVIYDKEQIIHHEQINEGIWKDSAYSGYIYRLDSPKFDHERLHVHIARKKHINAKTKQVSWNDDGTRHDKKTFNDNFSGLETAKRIARQTLGLSDDVVLEAIEPTSKTELLLESVENLPRATNVFVFHIISKPGIRTMHVLLD